MTHNDYCSQAREFYLGEMNDYLTYSALAQQARDPELRALLQKIADTEHGHAGFWKALLERHGEPLPEPPRRNLRRSLFALLMRVFDPLLVVSALELGETSAAQTYYDLWRSGALEADDRKRLGEIIVDELDHEAAFRKQSGSSRVANIRDFILGMNDGLVEILGAVTGLSAAYPGNPLIVAVSGLIVGVAGALSMGIGAWVSVRSQRQVNESLRQRMDILFGVSPQRAREEYRHKLEASGVPAEVSGKVVEQVADSDARLADLLLEKVAENEWRSALFTGSAYLFGVAFPVLPYFVADSSTHALLGSVLFAGLALASVGTLIAMVSGISLRTKVMEMTVSGLSAAGLAYLFGRLMQILFGVEI